MTVFSAIVQAVLFVAFVAVLIILFAKFIEWVGNSDHAEKIIIAIGIVIVIVMATIGIVQAGGFFWSLP